MKSPSFKKSASSSLIMKQINFKKLMNGMADIFISRIELAEKELKLSLNIGKNIPEIILTDNQKLQQVVFNLISNAFKFTNFGEIVIDVKVINDKLQISVRDTGQGMDQHTLSKIATPFFKNENDSNMYGIGLGLTIVNSILDSFGVKLEIFSEINYGTTVTFKLPLNLKEKSLYRNKSHKLEVFRKNSTPKRIKKHNTTKDLTHIKRISPNDQDSHSEIKMNRSNDDFFDNATVALKHLAFDINNIHYNIVSRASSPYPGSPTTLFRRRSTKPATQQELERKQISLFEDEQIHVMIVDDEKLIRQSNSNVVRKYFSSINLQVNITECADGVECLYNLYKGQKKGVKYKMIITDETMNFMRGSSTARIIKTLIEDGALYKVNMFMLTSYEVSVVKTFNEFFDLIHTKPLNKDHINEMYKLLSRQ
jgi:anti-sigma regulatory factor (Ser/Thr protein kinase)/CheY-like chemotaxis protein